MKKFYLAGALIFSMISNAQDLVATVSINESGPLCHPGDCLALNATYTTVNATDQYAVSPIVYAPSFLFEGGTQLEAIADDIWSPAFELPFNFCFYGNTYNQILVGSNGVISFDTTGQTPLGFCNWQFTSSIPSTTFPIRNAIYGVYQDNNIATPPVVDQVHQNVNYYILDTGINAAPNRVFVVNYNELPMFQCDDSAGLQTSQIVLHETTNIIEIFIKKRTACVTWNSGNGLVGIQNQEGTMATVPPGRNTGAWSATFEGWRFTPTGTALSSNLTWLANGVPMASGTNPMTVCPTESTVYSAALTYTSCGGIQQTIVSNGITLAVPAPTVYGVPLNISNCENETGIYTADLTFNDPIILSSLNAGDYTIGHFTNLTDAQNFANQIPNPGSYTYTAPMTIYVTVYRDETGCADILTFNLEINPTPEAPSGDAVQYFTPGQTLADLVVSGQNILWYDSAVGGSVLPESTLLTHNTTYFASQTVSGCESRLLPGRLAVTVSNILSDRSFDNAPLQVFPNPATNSISVSGSYTIDRYELFNNGGQRVANKNGGAKEIKIDVSNLAAGTYYLKLFSANQDRIEKIVIR